MVHWWQCCTGRQVRGEGFSRYGRRAGVGAALGLVLVMVGGLRRRCSVDDDGDSCLVLQGCREGSKLESCYPESPPDVSGRYHAPVVVARNLVGACAFYEDELEKRF